jgi:6-phosphogluconolactonase
MPDTVAPSQLENDIVRRRFLVGTYTSDRTARGVYLCSMDPAARIDVHDVCASPDPSFVVVHPRLPLAYAVNETPDGDGELSVISIDGDRLHARQRSSSAGHLPCHLALVREARALAVTHYGCGAVNVFELDSAGALTGARETRRHEGAAGHSRRQKSAHPHCVVGRSNAMYVTDLGQDCVACYAGDVLRESSRCAIHPGAGPRHLCFAASGDVAWLSNELDNTVSRLAVHADGRLVELDWVTTLPGNFAGRSYVSEIAVHPSAQWLYVANRGHDSIAWYRIGAAGRLTWCGAEPTQGRHPRHFALTSDGRMLMAANRDSDSLVAFVIDPDSGRPAPVAAPFTGVPAPACVRWL